MSTERKGTQGEGLLEVRLEATSTAPGDVVYDLLVDLERHLEWGGTEQKKGYRLTSIEAPPGPAAVGTEFRTTGIDPGGTFTDSSVVTEANPPDVFEFVTEARQQPKRGEAIVWTNVHRYEIVPSDRGCTIRYAIRVVKLSRRAWWLNPPGKLLVRVLGGANSRVGLKNLARMAEERAAAGRS